MSPTAVDQQTDISLEERIKLIEAERENFDFVKTLRANKELYEFEAYSVSTKDQQTRSLTAGSLQGPGMFIVRPICYYNKSFTEFTSVIHLGTNLCGHDGIIHGGLAATLLDESLAGAAFPSLPNQSGFTANLNINYKKPIKSNQWVIIKAKLDKLEGRKAFVSAIIQSMDEQTTFTEATSLYISPKEPIKSTEN